MKNMSIRLKITLWFSTLLILIVSLTYFAILIVSDNILQKSIQDNLIETVESNVDEIEFFESYTHIENDYDHDLYIEIGNGILEIDDDYLDRVNGISTALYLSDGTLLYGENPISKELDNTPFSDGQIQKKSVLRNAWYIFDRRLTQDGLDGMWLRGIVSVEQEAAQMSSIVKFSLLLMPLLLLIAIVGGYIIAGRMLNPIRQISETASQISSGTDLKRRIPLKSGNDEVHQLAHSFNEMFDRLDNAFETERQFTSDVSHELRTPMTVIMAQCEYTLEADRTPDEYQNALSVIHRQGGKMARLIEDMLTFTRLECKSDHITMIPLDFSQLVSSVSEDMALLQDKGITLETSVEPGICVCGNSVLLTRLLNNLIGNAYRYGKQNGHISVTLSICNDLAVLSVEDDGIGISAEDQQHIFRRFFQADQARSGNGTGLGLSMAWEIAKFHDGTLSVESTPGTGSAFTFKIKKNLSTNVPLI